MPDGAVGSRNRFEVSPAPYGRQNLAACGHGRHRNVPCPVVDRHPGQPISFVDSGNRAARSRTQGSPMPVPMLTIFSEES